MKLKPIGNNQTELHLDNGTVVLFSYQTPVAAVVNGQCYRTTEYYSKTTSQHINKWCYEGAEHRNPSFFTALVEGKQS